MSGQEGMFEKARDLAKSAMNRAQSNADAGQMKSAQEWSFIADGWARIAGLYNVDSGAES